MIAHGAAKCNLEGAVTPRNLRRLIWLGTATPHAQRFGSRGSQQPLTSWRALSREWRFMTCRGTIGGFSEDGEVSVVSRRVEETRTAGELGTKKSKHPDGRGAAARPAPVPPSPQGC